MQPDVSVPSATWHQGDAVAVLATLPAWYTEAHGEREAVAKEQGRLTL